MPDLVTHSPTERIVWRRVGLTWRPVSVERGVIPPAEKPAPVIDWAALCEACNERPRLPGTLARYCPDCSPKMRAKARRDSELRRRHPCPGCGIYIRRGASRCRDCYLAERRAMRKVA